MEQAKKSLNLQLDPGVRTREVYWKSKHLNVLGIPRLRNYYSAKEHLPRSPSRMLLIHMGPFKIEEPMLTSVTMVRTRAQFLLTMHAGILNL